MLEKLENPNEKTSSLKKVLIITYYWPPSGGPGVQRVLKFAKYLPEFGWKPIVFTVKNGEYPAIDKSLLDEVPNNCKVYRSDTVEFFSLFKILSGRKREEVIETYILNRKKVGIKDKVFQWIRQNFFIPDARIGWYFMGFKKGMKIIEHEKPDLIFASSPPHSLQLLAKRLSKKSGLPWIADFRDPWTQAFWDQDAGRTRISDLVNQRLEYNTTKAASACTTVSKGVAETFPVSYKHKFHIIPNGFDTEDFEDISFTDYPGFKITYAGHMASSQNPTNLWKSLKHLSDLYPDQIHIDLFGSIDSAVRSSIINSGLIEMVNFHGYIPHDEVIKEIFNTDVLLLLIPQKHGKGILTGKLFEYMATGNFILGIGDPECEAAKILNSTNSGKMFGYEDDLTDILTSLFSNPESGKTTTTRTSIQKYSRKSLTNNLVNLFAEVCS